MYKIIAVLLPIVISIIEIAKSDDIKTTFSSLSDQKTIALIGAMIVIVGFIAIYSSQRKVKFFVVIFSISIIGGNLLSLVVLTVFGEISFPNSNNWTDIEMFILEIIRFGAIPSIGIAVGLLTPPMKDIGGNLSD